MKRYRYSHWFWFFILFCFYGIYDVIKHISQEGSLFEENPGEWFLFSFVSILTISLSIYFSTNGLQLLKVPSIVADLLAFICAFSVHLGFTGPLWDHFFWPYSKLDFHLNLTAIGALLAIYIAYRIVFAVLILVIRKFSTHE